MKTVCGTPEDWLKIRCARRPVVEQFLPDLAVLDVRLPVGPDGYAMAGTLRCGSGLPVLFSPPPTASRTAGAARREPGVRPRPHPDAAGVLPVDAARLVRLPANLRATLRLVSRRERGFTVTAKGRTGRERARVGLPRLHTVLVAASIASDAWFVATSAGLTPMRYEVPWAANGSALWLAVNSILLTVAVRRIRKERYGAERRAAVRFPVEHSACVTVLPGFAVGPA